MPHSIAHRISRLTTRVLDSSFSRSSAAPTQVPSGTTSFLFYWFIFWLLWVFRAVLGLSLVAVLRGFSSCEVRLSCPTACGILVLQPGIEPMSPALEGRFLTTGPPGKSPSFLFYSGKIFKSILSLLLPVPYMPIAVITCLHYCKRLLISLPCI